MNKFTYATVLLLLTCFSINAQITQQLTNKEKAEKYLSTKGELTFSFKVNDNREIEYYTKDLSIVNYDSKTNTVVAWANEQQFRAFEAKNIAFEVPKSENEVDAALIYDNPTEVARGITANTLAFPVANYPTYADYAQQMQDFEDDNPTLVDKFSIGTTTDNDGKEILFVKISDNVGTDEQEPKLMLTSSMHGDEIAGYPMMLSLIDYILTVYADTGHADHTRIKNLVENAEIWINPSANPDGTYYNSVYPMGHPSAGDPAPNLYVDNARRANANGWDLNRNYPDNVDGPHPDGNSNYELETQHFMALADANQFVISANFHGGTELVNYPFDNAYASTTQYHSEDPSGNGPYYTHPDGDWFEFISVEYATHAQTDSPAGYMTVDDDSYIYPSPGVTHGAEWYRVYGGRQDYMNFYQQCREVTVELSDTKIIFESSLVDHWLYNRDALLDFLAQGTYGFTGIIKDATTGISMEATVTIVGHDAYGSFTTSDSGEGDYYRPIKGGTYDILFEAPCYQSFTLTNQTIADYETKVLADVLLTAGSTIPSNVVTSNILSTSATVSWNAQTGNTFDLRYRVIGAPSWTEITDLATNSYSLSSLTASSTYEVQVRSRCTTATSAYSSSTNFTTTAVAYCNSSSSATNQGWISNVTLNTIDNLSTASSYTDYTASQSTDLLIGDNFTIFISNGITNKACGLAVWIDYNKDGDFTDTGENVTSAASATTSPKTGSFTIPASAILGTTRMRVSLKRNGIPTSCETGFTGEVEDYTINITSPPNETSTNGNWNDDATWLYGIPLAIQDVILNHNVTVTTNPIINNVLVNNATNETGELKINAGKSLKVNGDLTVTGINTNGVLMLSSSAQGSSLIVEGTTGTGIGKYSRITAVASSNSGTNDLISAPFAGDTFFSVVNSSSLYQNGTTGDYLFGPFYNAANPGVYEVYNSTTDALTVIESGKGYRAGTDAGENVIFTGTIRTDQVDISITDEIGNYGSWNLIGNPYPSYLSFKDFFDLVSGATGPNNKLDPSYTAVFGYDADNSVDGGESIWTIWDFNNTTYATDLITPGQGFFVKAKAGAGTVLNDTQVTFTPSMREIGTADDFISGRMADTNLALAKLKLTNSNNSHSTNIYFRDINTRGLDPGYDTGAYNQTALGIYTHLVEDNNGVQLANQSLPYNDLNNVVVPLVVNADQGVQINISLDATSTVPGANYVYLEDNVTNSWTLLNSGDYTFTPSIAISGTGRFFVHFSATTLSLEDNDWNGLHIYTAASSKELFIKGQLSGATTADLYDLQGRLILTRELNQYSNKNTIDISSISTGIYIVKVDSGNQTKTQKVIIK